MGLEGEAALADSCLLRALPVELFQQVLGMLGPQDRWTLLQSSKVMALEVMQHSARGMTFQVELESKVSWAAIRQLLRWAPASLKLMLTGQKLYRDWDVLVSQLSFPCPTLPLPQQCPFIHVVTIKDFRLRSLVPSDLATICPNLQTLHLISCTISPGGADSSSARVSGSTGVWPAQHLHTLTSDSVYIVQPSNFSLSNMIDSHQSKGDYASQLWSAVPSLRCLKLLDGFHDELHVAILGPQLEELHVQCMQALPSGAAMHLQNLQKLMLPQTKIASATMEQLLSLPSLTHLEVDTVSKELSDDYSTHPCKWRHLHLHCHKLDMDLLAKLPLHSLTHPLVLGCRIDSGVQLRLPIMTWQDNLVSLRRLAQGLTACRVQLVGELLLWAAEDCVRFTRGADLASLLTLLAPSVGPQADVGLSDVLVDQAILKAVATVYGSSLKQLVFDSCDFVEDMQPVWHGALPGLPNLVRLELHCYTGMVKHGQALAAAMARQPAGRHIWLGVLGPFTDIPYNYPDEKLIACVRSGMQQALAGVDITVHHEVKHSRMLYGLRIRSTSMP